MAIKTEDKIKTVTVFIASDGKEYDNKEACMLHEEALQRKVGLEWLREHAEKMLISSSLYAYITRDCPDNDMVELFPIRLTKEAMEALEPFDKNWFQEDDEDLGKLVFISVYDDEIVYLEWEASALVTALTEDAKKITENIK